MERPVEQQKCFAAAMATDEKRQATSRHEAVQGPSGVAAFEQLVDADGAERHDVATTAASYSGSLVRGGLSGFGLYSGIIYKCSRPFLGDAPCLLPSLSAASAA